MKYVDFFKLLIPNYLPVILCLVLSLFGAVEGFSRGVIVLNHRYYTTFDKVQYAGLIENKAKVYLSAELVDGKNAILSRQKIIAENGLFRGSFNLNNKIETGFYWVRLYPAASGEADDFLIYSHLVIINADDLDNEIWEKNLLSEKGEMQAITGTCTDEKGNPGYYGAIIDEQGRIYPGTAALVDASGDTLTRGIINSRGLFIFSGSDVPANNFNILYSTGIGNTILAPVEGSSANLKAGRTLSAGNPIIEQLPGADFLILETNKELYPPAGEVNLRINPANAVDNQYLIVSVNENIYSLPPMWYGNLLTPWTAGAIQTLEKEHITNTTFPEQKGLSIYGSYINPETGRPRTNYRVALSKFGGDALFETTPVDAAGNFYFNTGSWKENNTVVISTIEQEMKGVTIRDLYFREQPEPPCFFFNVNSIPSLSSFVSDARIRLVLKDQYTEPEPLKQVVMTNPVYDTTRVCKNVDITYNLDEYIQFADMAEVIREIMPYVNLNKVDGKNKLRIFNSTNPDLTDNPLFLVNGIPTRNTDFILGLDVSRVQFIELLYKKKTLEPFGLSGFGGILAVYTNSAVDVPNSLKIHYQGIHQYEDEPTAKEDSMYPDLSPSIYWNPGYKPAGANTGLTFTLNDIISELNITVTGISGDGKIYQVQKQIKTSDNTINE